MWGVQQEPSEAAKELVYYILVQQLEAPQKKVKAPQPVTAPDQGASALNRVRVP